MTAMGILALLGSSLIAGSGTAQAANVPTAVSPVPAPKLAPCTKPLLGADRSCASESTMVDRWFNATVAGSSCSFDFTIDWGDRTPDWTGSLVDPSPGIHLLATHYYDTTTQKTYTETVYNSVVAGSCTVASSTVFKFTHLLPNKEPWWVAVGISKACAMHLTPDPASMGLSIVDLLQSKGIFLFAGRWRVLFEVLKGGDVARSIYDDIFNLPKDCGVNKAYSLGPLPAAYVYGAKHPGKLFKPRGRVLKVPQVTAIGGYTKGVLAYFRLVFSDPGRDAKGFGFTGINGAGWAQENHPFTKPSYGIVGRNYIDYPFNLLCGTSRQFSSWVEAWIYNTQGIRSYPVKVALNCT